jgi:hypothetical protein
MGNSSSSKNGSDDIDKFDGIDTLGYRVLGVQPNSPASAAGLVSFLDFLAGADQKMLLGSGADLEEGDEYDDVDLPALLQEHLDRPLELCKCVTRCFVGGLGYPYPYWDAESCILSRPDLIMFSSFYVMSMMQWFTISSPKNRDWSL